MSLPKNQINIPVLTLKSGVFTYKNKSRLDEKTNESVVNEPPVGLYPKIDATVNGTSLDAPAECSIIYEDYSSEFYFKVPCSKNEYGEIKYTMLECTNISAADIKVNSKYGWETMYCRLLVECRDPLVAWSTNLNKVTMKTEYIRMQQESCMVKATFDISVISQLKHLLSSLKVAQLKSRKQAIDKIRKGETKIVLPAKMQEGLPEWVNYIPAKWYSCTVRKIIEYCLITYTILTLLWAIWQLYKHVDFIRRYIRPVLDFIEFYVEILKSWIKWIDSFADLLTRYWWKYMKPVYVLFITLYTSLAQLFKPLRNIAGVLGSVLQPFIQVMKLLVSFLKPVLTPFILCFRLSALVYRKAAASIVKTWTVIANTTLFQLLIRKLKQTGITNTVHNVIHGGLDPFRAQFVVIRDLLLKSVKQIYYGVRFIWTRMYMTFLFWRRERQYAKEELEDKKPKNE